MKTINENDKRNEKNKNENGGDDENKFCVGECCGVLI